MKKLLLVIFALIFVFGVCATGFANTVRQYEIKAMVPQVTAQVAFTLSKVMVADCTGTRDTTWIKDQASLDFGTLAWDNTNKIFAMPAGSAYYYALDIGVTDNSNTNWSIMHTKTPIANGSSNLDNNINVAFNKQISNTVSEQLDKVAYSASAKTFTKAQLAGGWLRIYYGISNGIGPTTPNPGNCSRDAIGVVPLGGSTTAGTYRGTVTITVNP